VVLAQLFKGMQVVARLWQRYGELGRAGLQGEPEGASSAASS
jgi:hypothetical protein